MQIISRRVLEQQLVHLINIAPKRASFHTEEGRGALGELSTACSQRLYEKVLWQN